MRSPAVVLATLVVAGCAASNPASPLPPTSFTSATYDGSWSGQTAQAKSIGFTVSGGAVRSYTLEYELTTPGCSGGGGGGGIVEGTVGTVTATITGGAFTISFTPPSGSTLSAWTMTGTFTSDSAATGTLVVTPSSFYPSACVTVIKTTWTATKGL